MRQRWVILIMLALVSLAISDAAAAVYKVRGQVVDSISGEPVPYAAVEAVNGFKKVLADEEGRFAIDAPRSFTEIVVTLIGFTPKRVAVDNSNALNVRVPIVSSGVALGEVIAKPKKEHYSKRNNPAVEFMQRIRRGSEATDPKRNPYYNYDSYERITLALNDMKEDDKIFTHFPNLKSYVDTSDVSHNTILNISVKEKVAEHKFRNTPRGSKTYITGLKRRGVDEIFDQQSIQVFLDDVLREIDVYDNDINILQNRFVSPLSRMAPDFYKFYLSDTVRVDTTRYIVLSFVPRTSASFGFTGRFFVEEGDTTMFIKKIEMNVPHEINLNFIDHLYIAQEFERAPDGSRLKTRDDLTLEMNIFGMKLYTRRNSAYTGHNFREVPDEVFASLNTVEELPGAEHQTDDFWAINRLVDITDNEDHLSEMVTELRRSKFYYWAEKIIHVLFSGYLGTGNPSYFDIGPVNTMLSGNSLEGLRMRLGGMTTVALSRRWFVKGFGAYGTGDHRWKYKAEVEYSFHDKKLHAREFPVHSIAVSSGYDVDMLGQHYMFTNPDNFVLSLKRCRDTQIIYKRDNNIKYTLELWNNFSVTATAGSRQLIKSRFMEFIDGYGRRADHYTENYLSVALRFAPGEKFFQTRTQRIPVNLDAPVIVLSHTIAPKGLGGSAFTLNTTELSFQKRVWFSSFGFLDMIVRGGHVWSRVPYPSLLIPNANLSYTIQPESFALMNAMEFINDTYGSWDLTYWINGAIFNYIPLLKKLKLREVIGFRGICGHLSEKNRPWLNPSLYRFPELAHTRLMTSRPYMEISAGLDNLFKVLRLDYVWRLSYRDTPGAPKSGLRVAVHVTF